MIDMIRTFPRKPPVERRRRMRRTQMVAIRRFQYRYAFALASFGLFLSVLAGGVTFYLLNHNYQLFVKAELITAPRMVDNLYRELKLANEMLLLSYVGFVLFLGMVGIRFSHRIVIPVMLVEEKLREVSRGDLAHATVSIRKSDEFQELCETYNYMVESLRIQVKNDLSRIEKLKPDVHNRDAVHAWEMLISEKKAQLNGIEPSSSGPIPSLHHAS